MKTLSEFELETLLLDVQVSIGYLILMENNIQHDAKNAYIHGAKRTFNKIEEIIKTAGAQK